MVGLVNLPARTEHKRNTGGLTRASEEQRTQKRKHTAHAFETVSLKVLFKKKAQADV